MDIDVYGVLYARKKTSGYVFVDKNRPWNSPRLNLALAKACERAGVRKITWHVLRHTFATQIASKSVPLNTLQVLLGHSSITTTMRYAHVAPSTLHDAIKMLNPKTAFSSNFGQPVGNEWMKSQSPLLKNEADKG